MIATIKINCKTVNICIKVGTPEKKKKMSNKFFAMLNIDNAFGKPFSLLFSIILYSH